jgi:hypothetical protein
MIFTQRFWKELLYTWIITMMRDDYSSFMVYFATCCISRPSSSVAIINSGIGWYSKKWLQSISYSTILNCISFILLLIIIVTALLTITTILIIFLVVVLIFIIVVRFPSSDAESGHFSSSRALAQAFFLFFTQFFWYYSVFSIHPPRRPPVDWGSLFRPAGSSENHFFFCPNVILKF